VKRPAPTPENKVIFAALVWVSVSFGGMVLSDAGVYGAQSVAEIIALIAMVALFPDEPRRKWSIYRMVACVATALGFLAAWIVIHGEPQADGFDFPRTRDFRTIDVVAGFVATGIVAPLFEEKLARHLALRGIHGMVGPAVSRYVAPGVVASLIVSTIFALAHPSLMPLAFLLSLALCHLALKYEFDLVQRAVIHGLLNSGIMAWYFTNGFGSHP